MSLLLVNSRRFLHLKRSWKTVSKASTNVELALSHFDSFYGKVYGEVWPSMRLGLLSTKKQCAVLNTFVNSSESQRLMVDELGALDLRRYYKKHLKAYTMWKLREKLLENKRARRREMMAKSQQVDIESIDPNTVEISDISDSELRTGETTGESEGFSSAEDLMAMFSDRRLDDDERYFDNRASVAISLNDYVPSSEFIYREDMPNELSYYDHYEDDIKLDIETRDEPPLELSEQLNVCSFPKGSWSKFSQPPRDQASNLSSYYLMDGASILPVLAMDIQMGDHCADYCAAPGGKSLAMMMTLRPEYLFCNDISKSRVGRIKSVINQYVPDIEYRRSTLHIVNNDARSMVMRDTFDKILVDVPCSNDRISVTNLDDNIFKRSRTEERIDLPKTQSQILRAALMSLKSGGSVVYSTCTLSPMENDAVIQKTLLQLQEMGYQGKFAIVNLKEAFRPLRGLFRFNTKFKYGQQVIPSICSNYGPMYISKIKRIS